MINVEAHAAHCRMANISSFKVMNYLSHPFLSRPYEKGRQHTLNGGVGVISSKPILTPISFSFFLFFYSNLFSAIFFPRQGLYRSPLSRFFCLLVRRRSLTTVVVVLVSGFDFDEIVTVLVCFVRFRCFVSVSIFCFQFGSGFLSLCFFSLFSVLAFSCFSECSVLVFRFRLHFFFVKVGTRV